MVPSLPSFRGLFEVPEDVVFLNSANIGPRLRAVRDAERGAADRFAKPWTIGAPEWFSDTERLRGLAAALMNSDAGGVAIVPSVSYAMAVAARNVRIEAGQSVVMLEEEFPSNYYAWKRAAEARGAGLRVVRRDEDGSWTEAVLRNIDASTAVVSVPPCHWADGSLTGIERIARQARAMGAALVIDASQSLGVLPLDVPALDPDFLVSVGYKWLLGPFGVSFLYVAPRHRRGIPLEESWPAREGSEDLSRLVEYRDAYRDGARRFDAGEIQNFLLLPPAIAALEQITAWTPATIRGRLAAVTAEIAGVAEDLDLVPTPAAVRAPHLLGLRVGRERATAMAASLRAANVHASARGESLRIAPHLHTTSADVAILAAALRDARGIPDGPGIS